jgi:hypothetical protein
VGLSWPMRVPTFTVSRTFSVRLSLCLSSLCCRVLAVVIVISLSGNHEFRHIGLQVVYLRKI